jgi:hypothetical protein
MKQLIIAAMTILSLGSCEKVIEVDINAADPKIVIEGVITTQSGPYRISVTKTVNLDEIIQNIGVTGAQIIIVDKTNNIADTLTEVRTGLYVTRKIEGKVGHTYELISRVDGQSYTATSTIPNVVKIDSISFEGGTNISGEENMDVVINFQDPPNVVNYYVFNNVVSNRRRQSTSVFEDRLSDGKYISEEMRGQGSNVERGDTITLTLSSVDRQIFNYMNTLYSGDNFSSPTPSNPTSNISNGALGYFSAQAVDAKTAIVK